MKKIRKAHGGKKIKDILNKSVITWHMNWFNTYTAAGDVLRVTTSPQAFSSKTKLTSCVRNDQASYEGPLKTKKAI